jgi:hypothetical protein
MAPIREAIHIPLIWEAFDENDELKNKEMHEKKAETLFNQLVWWGNALKEARNK